MPPDQSQSDRTAVGLVGLLRRGGWAGVPIGTIESLIAGGQVVDLLTWLIIEKGFGRAFLGRAVGLGIVSHLILDLATHGQDIVLWPGLAAPRLGLGLYAAAPMVAFFVELVYGTFCWYVYRGGPGLLALITIGNLANLSIFSPDVPGPEQYLSGRPLLLVTFIFVQIVVSLVLVGILARRRKASAETWSADRQLAAARAAAE